MTGHLIDEPSILNAWLSAVSTLAAPGAGPSFLTIAARTGFKATPTQVHALDECASVAGAERPSSVANVLFPRRVSESVGSVDDRLRSGWALFGRGRRSGLKFSGWRHTYFERMTGRWIGADSATHEIKENRLASIIEKLRTWGKDVEAAMYLHTDAPSDTLRPRGAPCLQYVQFRPYDKTQLELFAVYRSHDYFNKVLGNMIGLQRLGEFVAEETGREFVGQTIFSLHPFSDASKKQLKEFADSVRPLAQV